MGFHQCTGIFRDAYVGEELEEIQTGQGCGQTQKVCESQVAPGFWLEAIFVIKVDEPSERWSDDSGYKNPDSHGDKDTIINFKQ